MSAKFCMYGSSPHKLSPRQELYAASLKSQFELMLRVNWQENDGMDYVGFCLVHQIIVVPRSCIALHYSSNANVHI